MVQPPAPLGAAIIIFLFALMFAGCIGRLAGMSQNPSSSDYQSCLFVAFRNCVASCITLPEEGNQPEGGQGTLRRKRHSSGNPINMLLTAAGADVEEMANGKKEKFSGVEEEKSSSTRNATAQTRSVLLPPTPHSLPRPHGHFDSDDAPAPSLAPPSADHRASGSGGGRGGGRGRGGRGSRGRGRGEGGRGSRSRGGSGSGDSSDHESEA